MNINSDLAKLFEKYLDASNSFEKNAVIAEMIEYVFASGFDTKSVQFFARRFTKEQKQELIKNIFQELEKADKYFELKVLNTLSSFLLETTLLIQDQILPVYFENFHEESDFHLVFKTEQIFIDHWEQFDDKLKKRVFHQFLNVLDNPLNLFIEEGVYEILNILLESKSSDNTEVGLFSLPEIEHLVKRLAKIAKNKKKDTLYALLESIKQILKEYPSLINKAIYNLLYPLFRKLRYRFAYFYPARRRYLKIGISFLELMLLFEEDFGDANYIKYFVGIIGKMAKKVDHADIRNFLQLIVDILQKTKNIPKSQIITPVLEILNNLSRKKDRLDDYTNELLREIFEIIWPHLSDDQKSEFFRDFNAENSKL